ncbi:hypothetical protein BS47DRAFT_1381340 [Hydnum rufescens UP504]|uniref:Uncharacterized protein n=1 Tax=Hydnum rufescens UP504 TaxID=1448309 RepID=A0A9P6DYH0_9AGAM|nr:hypothetical protein BS47DRAFT_1381340 [Hydnum rufescens UP504]
MSAAPPLSQAIPNGLVSAEPAYYDERYEEKIHRALQNIRGHGIQHPAPNFLHHLLFNIPLVRSAYFYILLVITENRRYFSWLYRTWETFFYRTWDFIVKAPKDRIELTPESEESESTGVGDWLADVLFTFGGTVVLPFVLVLCLVARFPPLTGIYDAWSASFGGNLGLINSSNPNLFKSLTPKQAQYGKARSTLKLPKETDGVRRFNFDIAKLLLQIASVIYEHSNGAIHSAAFGGAGFFGREFAFLESPGDVTISRFCRQLHIEYQPISELGNESTAFAAVFWDPHSTWIVVALKGTGAVEFGEWLSDLDANMVPCPDIPGFGGYTRDSKNVSSLARTGGFRNVTTHTTPSPRVFKLWWLTSVNDMVVERSMFGCATATLIYSRMLMKPEEVGENGILRDAYLFGAPVVADPESVDAFNNKMFEKGAPERTMWRITSNGDVVATGLPEFGDYLHILDPKSLKTHRKNNLFLSHFGSEIVLHDHPHRSTVTGKHLTPKHTVVIDSEFSLADVVEFQKQKVSQWGEYLRVATGSVIQQLPLLGRIIAHFPDLGLGTFALFLVASAKDSVVATGDSGLLWPRIFLHQGARQKTSS